MIYLALDNFIEMKKSKHLDCGDHKKIKCDRIESNLKFAYDVKRLLAKYGIESIDGLEEILKEYDNIGG